MLKKKMKIIPIAAIKEIGNNNFLFLRFIIKLNDISI